MAKRDRRGSLVEQSLRPVNAIVTVCAASPGEKKRLGMRGTNRANYALQVNRMLERSAEREQVL